MSTTKKYESDRAVAANTYYQHIRGRRHELWLVFLLILLGATSGVKSELQ